MTSEFRIHVEAEKVLLLLNGRLIAELPWEAAVTIGRGLIQKGHEAEEYAKHQLVIADQALLFKVGAPFGLTNNRDIIHEAIKESGGIRSEVVFGTPTVIRHHPRNGGRHG